MKIKSLLIFIKLIDTGSYSIAAEKIGITQPAISMQIKSLEEKFNTELVKKEKGDIYLTPAGKIVYTYAKNIVNKWEELEYKVEDQKDKLYKNIIIGASTIPSEYFIPKMIAEYMKSNKDINSCIEVGDSEEMVELLEKDEVDFIIVGIKPTNSKFKVIEIAEDKLKLIVSIDHVLTKKKQISVKEIKNQDLLIREVGSGTRKAMLDGLGKSGININELKIKCRLGSTEAIIAGVETGLGISFVSSFASKAAQKHGRVVEVDVEGIDITRKFYLAYNKNKQDNSIIKSFVDYFNYFQVNII